VHEAKLLNLARDKAFHLLGWKPVWAFEKAVEATVECYSKASDFGGAPSAASRMMELTRRQIAEFQQDAARASLPWSIGLTSS
jgi:CDP-glucose 4,6-dehydratase